ncbi:unnamed protein product [Spodoptera exigua]|nr:unnamed protein product [Spodoptera exigua]
MAMWTVRMVLMRRWQGVLRRSACRRCLDAHMEAVRIQEPLAMVQDCADGSDEMQDLCDRILPATTPRPICILPAYPENGRYILGGNATGVPGQMLPTVVLKYSCDPQYIIVGSSTLFCYRGQWSQDFPECLRYCNLPKHHSIEYKCSSSDDETLVPTEDCQEQIPDGTTVYPRCRQPVYYSPVDLLPMRCEIGTWDHTVTCVPDGEGKQFNPTKTCDFTAKKLPLVVSPQFQSSPLSIGILGVDISSEVQFRGHLEGKAKALPATLQGASSAPCGIRFSSLGGGTLHQLLLLDRIRRRPVRIVDCPVVSDRLDSLALRRDAEVAVPHCAYPATPAEHQPYRVPGMRERGAAHCFWSRGELLSPANYVVAAGKLYRTWDHPNDTNVQISDIREIRVPDRFQGAATNFQDDIALLTLVTNLVYTRQVRPVCIDFDYEFDSRQLKVFSVGKVAGWGVTEQGLFSEVLRVADMPYVSVADCLTDIAEKYKAYITGDKFCAGYKNGI